MSEQRTACPYCGQEWPAELGMRFCGECGSKLGALSPEVTDKERRTLTVLFADLSGFTTFSEGRDPEAVEDVVDDLLTEMGEVVDSYGGYVDKYLGDAVMAVFGAPTAHEDDPFRAVRTGLELLDVVEGFNEDQGESLSVSVGINTGEVLWSKVGGGDFTVTGDAVNVAKRLESVADPGTVLLSEAVRERTDGRVRSKREDAVVVDGRDAPVQAYHAVALRSGDGTPATGSELRTPLVGRETELADLLDRYEEPESACVAVIGPAGIGKSRLLDAFTERLADRETAEVCVGHCSQHADVPLEPFGDVLLTRADTGRGEPDAGRAVVRRLVDDLEIDDEMRRENVAHLLATAVGLEVPDTHVTDLPPERLREEAARAWLTWLRERAEENPIVLAFEDLQWADEATLELLGALQDRLEGVDDDVAGDVALVTTIRPSGTVPAGFETVDLSSLSVANVEAIAEAVLDGPVDEGVPSSLHEQAGGNPYFLAELLRYLRENDLLAETDAGYTLVDEGEASVPESLDGLLVGRIDALDPGAKETLKGASVVGQRFWVHLLSDVLGRDTTGPVETLRDREMVGPREESAIPEDSEYALEHALLRDAAYELLPKTTRRELHGSLATELERRCESDSGPLAGRVAYHAEQAGEYGTAIEWYRRAGKQAGEGFAQADAIEQYRRALALAREHADDGTVAALQADLADVYETIGELESAREAAAEGLAVAPAESPEGCRLLGIQATTRTEQGEFEAAAEAARRQRAMAAALGDREFEVAAVKQLGVIERRQGNVDAAHEFLRESLELATSLDDSEREARIRKELGAVLYLQGEYDRAVECFERSLEIAREVGARQLEGACRNNLGIVADNRGEYERAAEYFGQSLEIDREIGDRQGEAFSLLNLGEATRRQGETDQARQYFELALELMREVGDRKHEATCLDNLGQALTRQREVDRAREHHERALDIFRDIGDVDGEARALHNLGRLACLRGEFDRARDNHEQALEIEREMGNRRSVARSLLRRAVVAVRQGRYGEARESVAEASDIAQEIGDAEAEVESLVSKATVDRYRGDRDSARESFERALDRARERGNVTAETTCLRSLAVLARKRGRHDAALEHLEDALSVSPADVEPIPLLQARLERARLALSLGDVDDARERVQRVQETVADLDAAYWGGRCRALQGEIAAASGSLDAAREHWEAALEVFDSVGAPDDALSTLELLADACREQGDEEGVRECHRRARDRLAEAPAPVVDRHETWIDTEQ